MFVLFFGKHLSMFMHVAAQRNLIMPLWKLRRNTLAMRDSHRYLEKHKLDGVQVWWFAVENNVDNLWNNVKHSFDKWSFSSSLRTSACGLTQRAQPFGTSNIILPPPWFSARCYCILKVEQTGKQAKVIKHHWVTTWSLLMYFPGWAIRIQWCLSGDSQSCHTYHLLSP